MNLHEDEEFKTLIPPLTKEECEGLEKSILEADCRDYLILCKSCENNKLAKKSFYKKKG